MDIGSRPYKFRLQRSLRLSVLMALLCVATFAAGTCLADDAPLNKTSGLYLAYGFSFGYDKCGEYVLGDRLREALIAKMESCPFTEEAKLDFYRKTLSDMNHGLSEMYGLAFSHKLSEPPKEHYCDTPGMQRSLTLLKGKLSDYDSGKIQLADVIVNVKDKPGEPISCAELSKSGYDDSLSNQSTGEAARASSSNK